MDHYYKLGEKGNNVLLDTDEGRFLLTKSKAYKVEHTLVVEDPGIDSRISHEFIKDSEDDEPELSKYQTFFLSYVDERMYIFWYSEVVRIETFY